MFFSTLQFFSFQFLLFFLFSIPFILCEYGVFVVDRHPAFGLIAVCAHEIGELEGCVSSIAEMQEHDVVMHGVVGGHGAGVNIHPFANLLVFVSRGIGEVPLHHV